MRTAVVTLAAGRHAHLRNQQRSLVRGVDRPDTYVAVGMGDDEVAAITRSGPLRDAGVDVVTRVVSPEGAELPLAAARNTGARLAIDAGAELLVFVDVDCMAGPDLLRRYRDVAELLDARGGHAPAILAGPVTYLPPRTDEDGDPTDPGALRAATSPHPARPAPQDDEIDEDGDLRLFWSLSFAVTARDWNRIGGFCEDYVGYGGEDTDFAQRAGAAGGRLVWVGGAHAYHQHHPTSSPPVQHLDAILRNANLFHDTWGWFPMEGWLDAFAERGLARHDADRDAWVRAD